MELKYAIFDNVEYLRDDLKWTGDIRNAHHFTFEQANALLTVLFKCDMVYKFRLVPVEG